MTEHLHKQTTLVCETIFPFINQYITCTEFTCQSAKDGQAKIARETESWTDGLYGRTDYKHWKIPLIYEVCDFLTNLNLAAMHEEMGIERVEKIGNAQCWLHLPLEV